MNPEELNKAVEDVKGRSLASIPSRIAQLVSLSSTRDYNTGAYCHDGLAFRFSAPVAEQALRSVHQEVFRDLAYSPLQQMVEEIDGFIRSARVEPSCVVETWKHLQPYRMLVPKECDPMLRELFFSNVRIALAVLEDRQVEGQRPQHLSALQSR